MLSINEYNISMIIFMFYLHEITNFIQNDTAKILTVPFLTRKRQINSAVLIYEEA